MKNTVLSIFLCVINIVTINCQNKTVNMQLIDENNTPIDGAYIGIINKNIFAYTDTLGKAKIIFLSDGYLQDSLTITHINYKPTKIDIQSIANSSNNGQVLKLQTDIKLLDEVIVTPLNARDLVSESIKLIPALFDPKSDYAPAVHADINIFDANSLSSIIYYKGVLQFTQPNKRKLPLVTKHTEIEQIEKDANEYLYPIRTNSFAEIIPIREQGVIQLYKKYTFDKYEYIQYRGFEAIQVHFRRKNGNFTQTGSIIIRKDNKAIVALQYSTEPMKNIIRSTIKGTICNTDLESHSVEINYALNSNYLYEFESGVYTVKYTNRRSNNHNNSIVLSSKLKTAPSFDIKQEVTVPIDKLFTNVFIESD